MKNQGNISILGSTNMIYSMERLTSQILQIFFRFYWFRFLGNFITIFTIFFYDFDQSTQVKSVDFLIRWKIKEISVYWNPQIWYIAWKDWPAKYCRFLLDFIGFDFSAISLPFSLFFDDFDQSTQVKSVDFLKLKWQNKAATQNHAFTTKWQVANPLSSFALKDICA